MLGEEAQGARVTLKDGMRLDRDLVVRWQAARQEAGVRLAEGKGLPPDDGRYALLTITPPDAPRAAFARDLTVLIDASGSMSGTPIARAKGIVADLIRSLDPEDRFEILAFSDQVNRIAEGPAEATPRNARRALRALDRLQAGGATEMTRAMIEALKPLRPDSLRQVVLMNNAD